MPQTYAFDAAGLLLQCQQELQDVILDDERRGYSSHYALYDMKEAMLATDRCLYDYFQQALEQHQTRSSSTTVQALYALGPPSSLSSTVSLLRSVLKEQQNADPKHARSTARSISQSHSYFPSRSATDSLLFRLIVALQLCLVRIDDASFVVTGRRQKDASSEVVATRAMHLALGCVGAVGFASLMMRRHHGSMQIGDYRPLVIASAKLGLAAVATSWVRKSWRNMWMTSKIVQSTRAIEDWNQQWHLVQSTVSHDNTQVTKEAQSSADAPLEAALDAAMSRRLVEYALHHTPESSVWHSQGELRFLMLKRAMDVFYASVGAAIKLTDAAPNWQTTLATAAAASFYSLTGASRRASEETSSSSARNLIQSAWGMVSLPAIKNLSLQASRILKGAAVADRIEIMGVSCFVLSREPAPEMAAAVKRFHRQHRRKNALHTTLSTIDEGAEHTPDMIRSCKSFARSYGRYRQRDVILHLTGGGFFSHIIASDLPYLLDWSASTGAVVICPEYALLPDHKFPDALHQVEDVYRALRSGNAVSALGFEVNRIVVTGESAGGNLAAALCVKLCLENEALSLDDQGQSGKETQKPPTGPDEKEIATATEGVHSSLEPDAPPLLPLPDALMLSCAVLNLSLELSYSRVVGSADPVLPSGLISAISDAYLPTGVGVDKKDPLASPFFATDAVLCQFPPTLLFASSNDPLLDDSVVFNQRLRCLGVESELRAAQNLPHAYLGLGTAGFPEARQVQQECQEWLKFQFTRHRDDESEH